MNSADDIGFIIEDVGFENCAVEELGNKFLCDYRAKWINVPSDASGMFTIQLLDTVNKITITMLVVTITRET